MLGPIVLGSLRLPSICTRPTSVPINPIAGEISAALRKTRPFSYVGVQLLASHLA